MTMVTVWFIKKEGCRMKIKLSNNKWRRTTKTLYQIIKMMPSILIKLILIKQT